MAPSAQVHAALRFANTTQPTGASDKGSIVAFTHQRARRLVASSQHSQLVTGRQNFYNRYGPTTVFVLMTPIGPPPAFK
jgi:hypothetical protein